jgi:hypothetical protein
VEGFVPNGSLIVYIDEALERRQSKKKASRVIYRDQMCSSREHYFVKIRQAGAGGGDLSRRSASASAVREAWGSRAWGRRHRGIGGPRWRDIKERPCTVGLVSVVALLLINACQQRLEVARRLRNTYINLITRTPPDPLLRCSGISVRRVVGARGELFRVTFSEEMVKVPGGFVQWLTDAGCYAASTIKPH